MLLLLLCKLDENLLERGLRERVLFEVAGRFLIFEHAKDLAHGDGIGRDLVDQAAGVLLLQAVQLERVVHQLLDRVGGARSCLHLERESLAVLVLEKVFFQFFFHTSLPVP